MIKALLGKLHGHADEDLAPGTVEQRDKLADWGGALVQLGHLLSGIGMHMVSNARERAEVAARPADNPPDLDREAEQLVARDRHPVNGSVPPQAVPDASE